MNVLAWIFGIATAGVFGLAGAAKLVDRDRARDRMDYSKTAFMAIGAAEVAAAVGVVVGLVSTRLEWIGLAAGVGLCCLMVGALGAHARVGDEARRIMPPAVMFVVALLFVIFVAAR